MYRLSINLINSLYPFSISIIRVIKFSKNFQALGEQNNKYFYISLYVYLIIFIENLIQIIILVFNA